MTQKVEGRAWEAVKGEVRAALGRIAVEWPGDTPRPSSPVPRVILDCSGTVLRIVPPANPRYTCEGRLGTSPEALRLLRPARLRV